MVQITKRSAFTALVILALGMSQGLGVAQTPQQIYAFDVPLSNQVATNSCATGEPVALSGNVHFQYTFTTDDAGVHHFTITPSNQITGVGQTSSQAYTASDSNTYTVNSSDPSTQLGVDMQSDLTPQGSGTTLTLVQTLQINVDINGNISAQVGQNATQCAS
jgi:hypothetical protein